MTARPDRFVASPNHDERPPGTEISLLVVHSISLPPGEYGGDAIERLFTNRLDPAAHPYFREIAALRVSSHFLIRRGGELLQFVPLERRAWHAGVSHWRGHSALNDRSIGIEIVNPGHEWGYRCFPALQMAAVCDLCLAILGRHAIPTRNVVGHSDVAPDRKQDPGELFDWPGLAMNGVGLWPDAAPQTEPADDVPGALRAIGYGEADLAVTLRAFQRHWLPEAITGKADEATRARLRAVVEAMA